MSLVIIGIVAIVVIAVIILLSLKYNNDQDLKCPYCQLDFTTDLFFLGENALVSCLFCHRWMIVSRISNKNVVKKIFEWQRPRDEE